MMKTHDSDNHIDMFSDLQFDLALDLLPLYIDGKTGPDSNAFVETMLASNEELSAIYQGMMQDLTIESTIMEPHNPSANADRDKRRRTERHHPFLKTPMIILSILVTYALIMIGLVVWLFITHTAML